MKTLCFLVSIQVPVIPAYAGMAQQEAFYSDETDN